MIIKCANQRTREDTIRLCGERGEKSVREINAITLAGWARVGNESLSLLTVVGVDQSDSLATVRGLAVCVTPDGRG